MIYLKDGFPKWPKITVSPLTTIDRNPFESIPGVPLVAEVPYVLNVAELEIPRFTDFFHSKQSNFSR